MRTRARSRLAWWIATWALVAIPIILINAVAVAHPLHSEAIERPCEIYRKDDEGSRIRGRCSFFVAAGYLIFRLDAAAGNASTENRDVISGAISLTQSTGSLFSDKKQLGEGSVTLAESSPQIVHMKPGTLASWSDGYVLEVSGTPAKAEGSLIASTQQSSPPVTEVLANYLEQGFIHIIPLGFDHILFVIGLFLLSPNLKTLLWQVSAFTAAHTLTLALGATGIVSLPGSIVEPLIALSIIWVAIENLLTEKLHRWRIAVVFCFGLLHGLGFAGALLEIGLSGTHFIFALLAFNLGVELGQFVVITMCMIAVGQVTGRPYYRSRVVVPASCLIAFIAAYWVIERINVV